MKRMLIMVAIAALTVSMSFGQFTKGTKSVSSLFSYSSEDPGGENSEATTTLSIEPAGSYFFMDNIAVDVLIDMKTVTTGDSDGKTSLMGFGASYYMNNIYGGAAFVMASSTDGDADAMTSNAIRLHGGYLHSMVENWYFDIGFTYDMGMGKVKSGSTELGDNERSELGFGVGVKTFF